MPLNSFEQRNIFFSRAGIVRKQTDRNATCIGKVPINTTRLSASTPRSSYSTAKETLRITALTIE